jgi:hypothetical protein
MATPESSRTQAADEHHWLVELRKERNSELIFFRFILRMILQILAERLVVGS